MEDDICKRPKNKSPPKGRVMTYDLRIKIEHTDEENEADIDIADEGADSDICKPLD